MPAWDVLLEGRRPRRYRPGQMVYLQGTEPDRFYYLLTGSVRSFLSTSAGEERVLTIHRAGDLMGEASFFDRCPRVSSGMTLEECLILPVDREQLDDALRRHPELAMPMLEYLARTVRLLSDHVDSAALPALRKVARWLAAHGEGAVRCTHEALGQAVGVSRVTVSRALGELARRGLVRLGYGEITVLRLPALRDLAEE